VIQSGTAARRPFEWGYSDVILALLRGAPLPRLGRALGGRGLRLAVMLALATALLAAPPRGGAVGQGPQAAAAVTLTSTTPAPTLLRVSPLDRSDEPAASAEPDVARRLNAVIPVSAAAVEAARPFRLAQVGQDRMRAIECLAIAIYYEAGYEPLEGRRAVAQVVLNRVRHPEFPKTVCGVIYEGADRPGCQFSFACDGSLALPPEAATLRQARAVAQEALAGYVEPSVGTATHYHADYVAPYWRSHLDKIRQVGAHIFYRWRGSAGTRAAFVGRYLGHEPAPLTAEQLRPQLSVADARPSPQPSAEDAGKITPGLGWTPSVTAPSGGSSAYERLLVEQGRAAQASDGRS
jgi:spore germination cell wall hydrolase CwlJ-like protein